MKNDGGQRNCSQESCSTACGSADDNGPALAHVSLPSAHRTSLSFMDWLKLEDINMSLYFVTVLRRSRAAKPPGQRQPRYSKFFQVRCREGLWNSKTPRAWTLKCGAPIL